LTGISHSEFNASKTQNLELFQIWIIPEKNGLKPRYDQAKFDPKDRQNQWQVVISPNPEKHEQSQKPLQIFQQSYFSLADLGTDQSLIYKFNSQKNTENGVYLIVIEGQIEITGTEFGPKDAAEITNTNSFEIKSKTNAKILVIETV
jgi:quercetin 2,3-dioxygenase